MKIKTTVFLTLIAIFAFSSLVSKAAEPTWLFTIPKAESLKKEHYNIGLIYFDFGITDNLDLGIHGLKYSIPGSNFAFGASIFPLYGIYVVFSHDIGSGGLHVGFKTEPYHFFAGLEAPISKTFNFIAELNKGLTAGVRILPSKDWAIDLFMSFYPNKIYEVGYYQYKYKRIEIEKYKADPWLWIVYSGKF